MNFRIIIITLCLVMIPALSFAQPHQPPREHREPKHVIKMIDKYEMAFILSNIDFDEEKTAKYIGSRKAFKEKRLQTLEQFDSLKAILHEMEESTVQTFSDDDYKEIVESFLNLKAQMDNVEIEYLNSLTEFLTYKETLQIIQLEMRVREEIRKHLRKKRKGERKRDLD